jgi:hypothetical protein
VARVLCPGVMWLNFSLDFSHEGGYIAIMQYPGDGEENE